MKRAVVWGALAVVVVLGMVSMAQAADHEYVGATKCKMCHKVEYTSWESTVHAKATEAAKAGREGEAFGPACLKCHATNSSEEMAGVQCEACHGPGGDYKKMSIMKDKEQALAAGLILPNQETCNGCHTGEGHSKKVEFKASLSNKSAIHEFKNPPSH